MKRLATPLMALALFLISAWLCGPLFVPGELPFRGSIESGYVGMSRFIAEHPNPWGWNPLPYCGLPTQFMYVPGVPYLAAAFMHLLPHATPDTVYRTLVTCITCLGPVTVFLFALQFTSRKWAFLAALAYSLISPSYMLFPAVEKDRGLVQLPWRLQVLAKYGEGPHNAGLTLLPLALFAVWRTAKRRDYQSIFAAAVLLAAIPLLNWVAAFALAVSAALLLIAAWGEPEFRIWRAMAAAGLAYLLACFWLTPSFIKTIAFNWPADAFGYQLQNQQMLLLAALVLGIVVIRAAFLITRGSFYFCFVTLCAFVFGFLATSHYMFGVDPIPESRRYATEFELFLALAFVEGFRRSLASPNSTVRICGWGVTGVMLLLGAPQLWAYATQGWDNWMPKPPRSTIEYQLAQWLADHKPQGRVFASGGLRFQLNQWFDLQQVGGGFETGLRNRAPVDMAYTIRSGNLNEDPIPFLKTLGVQYVVIHGPKSREFYRDFQRPERIANMLPVAFHTEDDTIYELPARPLAHLSNSDAPLTVTWQGPSALTISGNVPAGEWVSVLVNADPGWQATQNNRPLEMTEDSHGFITLHPTPGDTTLDLRYVGTPEQRIMAAISALAWLAAISLLARRVRGGKVGQALPPAQS